jgi:hypothetical protein
VTEDTQLAPTAIRLLCQGDSGAFAIEDDLIDPRWCDEAIRLLYDLSLRRGLTLAQASLPSWQSCVATAQELELALGIVDAPPLRLRAESRMVEIQPRAVELWIETIAIDEGGEAVEALARGSAADIDLLPSGAYVLALLTRDNARARDRDPKAAWESVLGSLEGAPEAASGSLALTAKLVSSIVEEDWAWSTAVIKKLLLDEVDGIAVVWLWHLGRKILEDTALARQCSMPELIDRLRARRRSPEAGPPSS